MLAPIQDVTSQSPSVSLMNKRALDVNVQGSPRAAPADEHHFRNHHVNYSFGQQPFRDVQKSQRVQNASGENSMANSSPGTFRTVNQISHSGQGFAGPNQANSSALTVESGSNAGNSKGQKSAVSMASVMGQFESLPGNTNGMPNIFAQSMQKAELNQVPGTSYLNNPKNSQQFAAAVQNEHYQPMMRQTQQEFVKTANRVESVEKIVSDGLKKGADRSSQHSLEIANMGLRKSQDGKYEVEEQEEKPEQPETQQIVTDAVNEALKVTQAAVQTALNETKVPQAVRDQMIQQGFRPSSKHDGQFEYESDSIEKYEMISNEFDYEAVRKAENFGIKQYKDCIYRGELNDQRQREGLGVLVYHNGRVYEGEWVKNKRSGRGYEVFSNGNSYHGTYEDNKANGKGVYQWQNGEVYDGEWLQGIKHGYGVWKGSNGESYIGQWVQSKAQGYGVHVFANGDKYEGEWHACLREGNGSDFFANGDCYVGQYKQGKPEGFGQYKWSNGSSYTGQFLNGLKSGHGKWKKKQADEFGNTKCNSYEGMYEADKKHGFGVFEWESGNRYEGNYAEDERHGYGVMKWTDESMYKGMWDQGIQHGIGVMIFPDGVRRAGIFEENVFKESLKRKEQLDPYRDMLKEDCLQILEDILEKRVQSKANLFGPANRSKAELIQREQSFNQINGSSNNADLGQDSNSKLPRDKSESREQFKSLSGLLENGIVANNTNNNYVNDAISDNASVLNQQMRDADKEDYNQTMQKVHPMRESIAASNNQSSIRKIQNEPGLPPMPSTSQGQPLKPGRTIEVQTELSMVTMEQYSQGYNSKAFMNKTQGFTNSQAVNNEREDISRQGSPMNQSNTNFQHVLSKAQFQNTKHNQEILGGDNPINDSESEWNRGGGSSMMIQQKPAGFMNATVTSMTQNPPAYTNNNGGVVTNNLIGQSKKRSMNQVQTGVGHQAAGERRLRSNDPPESRGGRVGKGNASYSSPYGQNNGGGNKMHQLRQNRQQHQPLQTNPRENKFMNRSQLQVDHHNREVNRSMPHRQTQNQTMMGPGQQNNFMISPGIPPNQFKHTINRNQALNLLGEQGQFQNPTVINSKKPPHKMFQSQYGASRFNSNGIFQQPTKPKPQQTPAPLPPPQHYNNQPQYSSMLLNNPQYPPQQYHNSVMDTPVQQMPKRHQVPHSEQQPPTNNNSSFPSIGARSQQIIQDTPVQHMNMKLDGLGKPLPPSHEQYYGATSQQIPPSADQLQQQQLVSNFRTFDQPPPPREDILTPSPRSINYQNRNQQYPMGFGDMKIAENNPPVPGGGSHIAVEPMFGQGAGNDYYSDAARQPEFGGLPGHHIRQNHSISHPPENLNISADLPEVNGGATYLGQDYRGKTSTSSQRTLRYNDFELVQKAVQNDPEFEMHVDEDDNKYSARRQSEPDLKQNNSNEANNYSDMKLQRLYESNQDPLIKRKGGAGGNKVRTNGRNSRQSLPKVVGSINHSIQQQQKGADKRRHLNSNDTEVADHTMNLHVSGQSNNSPIENQGGRVILPNNRIVQRSSLPPANNRSKISVNNKGGFYVPPNANDSVNLGKVQAPGTLPNSIGSHKSITSPKPTYKFVGSKPKRNSINRDGSNSNSRSRFDFVGPYAQNLKKPKLYEARSGVQKIALKNHIASLQQQSMRSLAQKQMQAGNGPFNSEVFTKKKSSFGGGNNMIHNNNQDFLQQKHSIDDHDNKHSHRFASHGRNDDQSSGNFVIQHQSLAHNPNAGNNGTIQLPPMGSRSQMNRVDHNNNNNSNNQKNKRVWVPYNKKLKLKNMQQSMQGGTGSHSRMQPHNHHGSHHSGNPLLNSND